MIYERIFDCPEFTVTQIGNWQHTRLEDGSGSWLWCPQRQSTLKRCFEHPVAIEYDGAVCGVCLIEQERLALKERHP